MPSEAQKWFIYFLGEFDVEKSKKAQATLTDIATEGREVEVTLCLCSPGGDALSGLALYNLIQALPFPVSTYAYGECSSIALTVFMAAERRIAAPTTLFISHHVTYTGTNTSSEAYTYAAFKPFVDKLGWGDAERQERFGETNILFNPMRALEWGVVTEIALLGPEAGDKVIYI